MAGGSSKKCTRAFCSSRPVRITATPCTYIRRHSPAYPTTLPKTLVWNPQPPFIPFWYLGLESAVTSNWKHFYCYLSDWIHTWLQICRVFLSAVSSRRSVLLHSLLIHSGCDDGTKTWANKRFRFESFWCWRSRSKIADWRLVVLPFCYHIIP